MSPLLVYEATVVAESGRGRRELAFDDFVRGRFTTAREPDELVTSVAVAPLAGWGQQYARLARFERPTLNTAVAVRVEQDQIAEARVAVGGLGERARRLPELEQRLEGARSGEAAGIVDGSRRYLRDTLAPVDDLTGSADYKLHLAGVLVRRALAGAVEAAA
jgi:carbon-monoxide dehydrogenase medium subunit